MTEVDKKTEAVMRGTAVMVTCLAQTMSKEDQERFVERLSTAYFEMRDGPHDPVLLQMMSWTRELVTGFTWTEGQGKPFLER